MELDAETIAEIRKILRRNCVVEVTVAFYDDTENEPLEPIDIGSSIEFDASTPVAEQRADVRDMLESLAQLFDTLSEA